MVLRKKRSMRTTRMTRTSSPKKGWKWEKLTRSNLLNRIRNNRKFTVQILRHSTSYLSWSHPSRTQAKLAVEKTVRKRKKKGTETTDLEWSA